MDQEIEIAAKLFLKRLKVNQKVNGKAKWEKIWILKRYWADKRLRHGKESVKVEVDENQD